MSPARPTSAASATPLARRRHRYRRGRSAAVRASVAVLAVSILGMTVACSGDGDGDGTTASTSVPTGTGGEVTNLPGGSTPAELTRRVVVLSGPDAVGDATAEDAATMVDAFATQLQAGGTEVEVAAVDDAAAAAVVLTDAIEREVDAVLLLGVDPAALADTLPGVVGALVAVFGVETDEALGISTRFDVTDGADPATAGAAMADVVEQYFSGTIPDAEVTVGAG